VTRLSARLGVAPNAITLAGIVAAGAVAALWAEGEIALGLLLAWLMTFLDTVDGKLARVTVTSSWLGNLLDHVTDFLHPPLWWVCLAIGLSAHDPFSEGQLWAACALILVGYVVGRLVEELFKRRIGYNAYLWRPFDSAFRLIVSRRNIILLIMTGGLLIGQATAAYLTAAAWTLVSVAVQVVRFAQACRAERRGAAETWLK
jgi:phosphatidylglycerophosphate synthase